MSHLLFCAAEARAEAVARGGQVLERGRRVLCTCNLVGIVHPCPLEVAVREAAALLQSDWLQGEVGTSQSLSGNLDSFLFFSFFFNLCIYFWLLTKGSTVPSHCSMSRNLRTPALLPRPEPHIMLQKSLSRCSFSHLHFPRGQAEMAYKESFKTHFSA